MRNLTRKNQNWLPSEIGYLKNNFRKQTDFEMSKHLLRTEMSVRAKRLEISLKKRNRKAKKLRVYEIAMRERRSMINLNKKITEMRYLISMCEIETNTYIKERYKTRLKKLSGL